MFIFYIIIFDDSSKYKNTHTFIFLLMKSNVYYKPLMCLSCCTIVYNIYRIAVRNFFFLDCRIDPVRMNFYQYVSCPFFPLGIRNPGPSTDISKYQCNEWKKQNKKKQEAINIMKKKCEKNRSHKE